MQAASALFVELAFHVSILHIIPVTTTNARARMTSSSCLINAPTLTTPKLDNLSTRLLSNSNDFGDLLQALPMLFDPRSQVVFGQPHSTSGTVGKESERRREENG